MDSSGAWLLLRTRRAWKRRGTSLQLHLPNCTSRLLKSLDQERAVDRTSRAFLPASRAVYRIGRAAMHATPRPSRFWAISARHGGTFEAIAKPKHNLRVAAIFHQVEETGINALPSWPLAFLIGWYWLSGRDQPSVSGRKFLLSTFWAWACCARSVD